MIGLSEEKNLYSLFLGTKEDESLAFAFSIIGFESKIVDKDEDLPVLLGEILEKDKEKYALIVMPEKYVKLTQHIREKLREQGDILPAFLFIPELKNPVFYQLSEIKELVRRALGMSLKVLEE